MKVAGIVMAAVVLAAAAAQTEAQVLSGRVLELGSERPIVAATISLTAGGVPVLSTQSDSMGAFAVTLPRSGWYRLRVDRLGYAPAESDTLEVGSGEFVQVAIRLRVTAVELAPLMVIERRAIGPMAEFYRRLDVGRRSGVGRFITREALDSAGAASLTTVLARVPLVGMVYDARGKASPVMLSQGGCAATLYLNGAPLFFAPGETLDDFVDPATLEGVEIYRNRAELPFDIAGPGECGAIVMWTRFTEPGSGGRWRLFVAGGLLAGLVTLFLVR